MGHICYIIMQCTWGLLQSLAGCILYLGNRKKEHFWYHGARVTYWGNRGGISLGMFIFLPDTCKGERDLLVHEYGHTIQSMLLGPLYLFVIGVPSISWAMIPYFIKKRREKKMSYYSFYTESWANRWGEKVTHEKSIQSSSCGNVQKTL